MYKANFEKSFLKDTEGYYLQKSIKLLDNKSVTEYLKEVGVTCHKTGVDKCILLKYFSDYHQQKEGLYKQFCSIRSKFVVNCYWE